MDAALRAFRRAVERDPGNVMACSNLGFAYRDRGDREKAIYWQRQALAADGNFANAYFGLALAYQENGQADEALKGWRRFLDLEPRGRWAQKARQQIEKLERSEEKGG